MFFKKKYKNRQVFGFLCDRALALRIKMLAGVIKVPIYCLCEHLLQLGLAHISAEIGSNLENLEPMEEELREHLLSQHLLVERLDDEGYEQNLIVKHAGLTSDEEKLAKAVIDLVKRFEDEGIPHGLAIEIIQELATRLERRRKVQQMERELRRQIDLETLQQINERFPGLIPGLLKLMAKYPTEDLERAVSPIR
ncbi:MAG: hypothetical protein E3J65_04275 [Dehalococcoidia bacterium]|nr:MAG: hypothetical protein E3J65_04275 [Dehalococcoidia bacterium]